MIRRRSKVDIVDLKRRFPASPKILCTVLFICICLSRSERDLQFIPGFAEVKKIRPLVVFIYLVDFITGKEGEREQTAR